MKIIELVLDETAMLNGIDAISIVESPAIEENFIALKNQQKLEFATQNEDKRLLIGPALIPNKTIYRHQDGEEFYVYFSKGTIRRASELFLMRGNQNNSTLEHEAEIHGLSVVESWIIEDADKDKSRLYGLNMPVGTWMVSVKVNNEDVWNNFVKTGAVKGFSIEGYFADKVKMAQMQMESFADYPDGVKSNAKNVLEWVEKNGWGSCGTDVGKQRANQLAKGEAISVDTIKRMYSYLSRHEADLDASSGYSDGCGKLMYDAWGGKAGLRWSESKLKELGEIEAAKKFANEDLLDEVENMTHQEAMEFLYEVAKILKDYE